MPVTAEPSRWFSQFNISTLSVELHYSADEVSQAQNVAGFPFAKSRSEIQRAIEVVATVEHEYFHFRHLLSSSIGYFIFYLSQIIQAHQYRLIAAFPFEQYIDSLSKMEIQPNKLIDDSRECRNAWVEITNFSNIRDSIFRFDPSLMRFVTDLIRRTQAHITLFPIAGRPNAVPFLINVCDPEPSNGFTVTPLPHLLDLIEGMALWKEYAYVSRTLWLGGKWRLRLTDDWLKLSYGQPRYRAVPDIIRAATGCNLSRALPGVIMDIALCPPLFSLKKRSWHEIHPTARLLAMLSVANELPVKFKRPDNIDPISADFYRDIEHYFCKKLAWLSVEENIQDTIKAIHTRVNYGRETLRDLPEIVDFAEFYDGRFLYALRARQQHLSTFLFPETNPGSYDIGLDTTPPAVCYRNRLDLFPWPDREPLTFIRLHALDVVMTLFVDSFLNYCAFDDATVQRSRRWYELTRAAGNAELQSMLGLNGLPSFDEYVSTRLRFDYSRLHELNGGHLAIKWD